MSVNYGLEKFSHLEDKIYRTIEQIKRERQQRESLEQELSNLRGQVDALSEDQERRESLEHELASLRGQIDTQSGDEQRESHEHELASLRGQVDKLSADKERLESQLQRMLGERHKIKHKVEGMLDTITRIDSGAEAAKR